MTRGCYSRRGIEQGKRPKPEPAPEPFRAIKDAANGFFADRGLAPNAGTWASTKDGKLMVMHHKQPEPDGNGPPMARKVWAKRPSSEPGRIQPPRTKMQMMRDVFLAAQRSGLIWRADDPLAIELGGGDSKAAHGNVEAMAGMNAKCNTNAGNVHNATMSGIHRAIRPIGNPTDGV